MTHNFPAVTISGVKMNLPECNKEKYRDFPLTSIFLIGNTSCASPSVRQSWAEGVGEPKRDGAWSAVGDTELLL